MTASRYETSLQICDAAAVELGKGNVTALFASADPDIILLRSLLNTCGRELGIIRPWRHLLKSGSFTAAAAAAPPVYGVNALPADFDYLIDGTVYDATDDEPLRTASEQVWQHYITNAVTPSPSIFRLEGNAIWLYDDAAGDTITYKYASRYWVKPTGETAPTLSASTADTDTIHHHPLLMTRLLKLRWRQARGYDSQAEAQDFANTLSMVAGREQAAPIIGFGAGGGSVKFIDGTNVPDGGYGT